MNTRKIELGTFTVESGALRVSDPCYTPDTWCAGVIPNVLCGTWHAEIIESNEGSWGRRVAELIVYHESAHGCVAPSDRVEIDVGVDSGQCGFYDEAEYASIHPKRDDYDTGRYQEMCSLTLETPHSAGVFDVGVVSSSGFGDGSYDCFIQKNIDEEVAAAKVVFITEDEPEDEEGDTTEDEE